MPIHVVMETLKNAGPVTLASARSADSAARQSVGYNDDGSEIGFSRNDFDVSDAYSDDDDDNIIVPLFRTLYKSYFAVLGHLMSALQVPHIHETFFNNYLTRSIV